MTLVVNPFEVTVVRESGTTPESVTYYVHCRPFRTVMSEAYGAPRVHGQHVTAATPTEAYEVSLRTGHEPTFVEVCREGIFECSHDHRVPQRPRFISTEAYRRLHENKES